MRLLKLIIIFNILLFGLSPIYDSVEVQAVENESQITIDKHLDNITEVRLSNQSTDNIEQADLMLSRLNKVDPRVLENVDNSGATLILSDLPLTELPEFSDLKGEVPRGHTDTWDNIPGLGGYESYVKVGASEPGVENNHGDINLELHEFGHMVDNFLVEGETVSHQDEFAEIHEEESDSMFPNEPYFQYIEEYFAEAFAYYYLSDETHQNLQQQAPKTAAFIENMHNKIFTVANLKSNGFVLEWDDFNAEEYEILIDGESYQKTSSTSIDIDDLDPNTKYDVAIKSLNDTGEVIDMTYTEIIHTDHEQDIDVEMLKTLLIESQKEDEDTLTDELKRAMQNGEDVLKEVEQETATEEEVDEATKELKEAYKHFQPRILEDTTPSKNNEVDETEDKEDSNVTTKTSNTLWIVVLGVLVVLIILIMTYLYFTGREVTESQEVDKDKNHNPKK